MTDRVNPSQVVVLAGGAATRLGALAYETPKILQPIGDRTFLDVMLEPLLQHGFRRFHFCTGHLGAPVADHLREHYRHLDTSIHHDSLPRGTAGALRASLDKLDDTFLMLLGDTYLPADYKRLVASWRCTRATTLLVTSAQCGVQPNIALEGDRVVRYDKSRRVAGGWVDAGAGIVERDGLSLLTGVEDPVDLAVLYDRLIAGGRLYGLPSDLEFWDIGTPERYARFASIINTGRGRPC